MSHTELVDAIAKIEFEAFDLVKNEGGRAFCQDDWYTFSIMRKSQYLTWNRDMLVQYLADFKRELAVGHNLITEKYGRMMENTAPDKYKELEPFLPVLSEEKKQIIEAIVSIQMSMAEDFLKKYPKTAGNARSFRSIEDTMVNTSYETYLRGEISTYSDEMLQLYGRYVVEFASEGKNIMYEILTNTAKFYGFDSVEALERLH